MAGPQDFRLAAAHWAGDLAGDVSDGTTPIDSRASAARLEIRRRGCWRWVLLGFVALGILAVLRVFPTGQALAGAVSWVRAQGALAPVIFIGAYVVGAALFVPGSVLTLGAGLIFGPIWGSIYTSIGSTAGATVSFLIGRFLARDWVASHLRNRPRFSAVDAAVAQAGWKIVLLLRLSPLFPFAFVNYALGLTRIPTFSYALASWAGMIPATVAYVWLGSVFGEAWMHGAVGARDRTPLEWGLQILGLLATVAVTVIVTRLARRALQDRFLPPAGSAGSTHCTDDE